MTDRPNIVVVEDERAQLLLLRTTLKGIGDIHEFTEPLGALEFLKCHSVDAAIIDVHMPRHSIDGLSFVRSLRKFDRELSVIIRTADTSSHLADEAIEVRAFRRAIKGHTSIDELRDLTRAAVQETRVLRQIQIDAAQTNTVKAQWVQTLGSVEEAFSVTDTYQALVQDMQNQLTALAGISEVMNAASNAHRLDLLRDHVAKNKVIVAKLLTKLTDFLSGPFAQTSRLSHGTLRSTANGVLGIVQKHFSSMDFGRSEQRSLSIMGLGQDMYIAAKPLKLLVALRHLIEFCLDRGIPTSNTRLTAHCIDQPAAAIDSLSGAKIVLTENSLNSCGACIIFRVSCQLASTSLQDIQKAFRDYPACPHKGNLQMIPFALRDELAAVTVNVESTNSTVFQLYVPLVV